jgi:uncharacterized protein YndB with AHSA1/START domain
MTTPNVPLRMELRLELPGTPDQVWDALATADGLSAWFLRTDLEEREGGAVCFHMGDDGSSEGVITSWEPPRRLVYEEPHWATLSGHGEAPVTPMVSEFVVEARSGGTCVVTVVTSAFGTGAEWEREFFDDMERHWTPFFDHLRLYLAQFPGQRATTMEANGDAVPGSAEALRSAMRRDLGATEAGRRIDARGIIGEVERIGEVEMLVKLTAPVRGYLAFWAYDKDDGTAWGQIVGYFFSEDAPAYVKREQAAWKAWAEGLTVHA